jgi:hypothetical protein
VLKKSLFVISVVFAGVVLNQASAFASTDYTQLCVAAGAWDGHLVYIGTASSTPLAATGAGMDVGAWVFAGIVILIVGLAFTLVPSRRPVDRLVDSSVTT